MSSGLTHLSKMGLNRRSCYYLKPHQEWNTPLKSSPQIFKSMSSSVSCTCLTDARRSQGAAGTARLRLLLFPPANWPPLACGSELAGLRLREERGACSIQKVIIIPFSHCFVERGKSTPFFQTDFCISPSRD